MSAKICPVLENDISHENKEATTGWVPHARLNACPGDLLEIDRQTYRHWAMVIQSSDGQQREAQVVHFHTLDPDGPIHMKPQAEVRSQSLAEVAKKSNVRINNWLDTWVQPARDKTLVNRRIKEFVAENKPYHMRTWNCEHFAKFCRYGVEISDQSRIVWVILSLFCVDAAVRGNSAPSVVALRSLASLSRGELVIAFVILFFTVLGFQNVTYSIIEQRHEVTAVIGTIVTLLVGINVFPFTMQMGYEMQIKYEVQMSMFMLRCVAIIVVVLSMFSVGGLGWVAYQMGLECKVSKDLMAVLICAFGLVYLAYVSGLTFALSLLGMVYVDDIVRLKHVASKDILNAVAYTIVMVYLVYVFQVEYTVSLMGTWHYIIPPFSVVGITFLATIMFVLNSLQNLSRSRRIY